MFTKWFVSHALRLSVAILLSFAAFGSAQAAEKSTSCTMLKLNRAMLAPAWYAYWRTNNSLADAPPNIFRYMDLDARIKTNCR
ncbi:MAG: hypothetical protein ACRDAM_07380 [Casimicrobium sp.]